MYRLYVAECREENVTAAKKHVYFDIFHKDFNLAFHNPKMDMCDLREKYWRSSDAEKGEMKENIEDHLKNKTQSRKLKEQEDTWSEWPHC